MATKREVLADPLSCWNKAGDDEPVFVLRAQDILAPWLVAEWANMVLQLGDGRDLPPKVSAAYSICNEMRKWPQRKLPD